MVVPADPALDEVTQCPGRVRKVALRVNDSLARTHAEHGEPANARPVMRELVNLLVLPLLALIVLALYFYPDRLEDLISRAQDFFHN